MNLNSIQLTKTGTYFFKSPTEVTLVLNTELAIVLCAPSHQACGIGFFDPQEDPKIILELLSNLYEKMKAAFTLDENQVHTKIFGLRSGSRAAMELLTQWNEKKGLRIVARDIGGNACRKMVIHCKSGKVGVSYSESIQPGQLQWIAEGSARQRNPMDSVQAEVLILTKNSLKRTLARQAIEEQRHWTATCPPTPLKLLATKKSSEFPYTVVLIFSDLENECQTVEAWIAKVSHAHPAVQFRWVGTELPVTLKRAFPALRLLPPLEPALLPEFKRKLKSAIFDHLSSERTELLHFPKVKKAK